MPQGCPTILVVDDEPMILAALAAFFDLEGEYDVVTCDCPRAALAHLEQHSVDLIISDFLMTGMDGLELLKAARRIDPTVPRILLTGYADTESAMRAINEAGLFQYIEKPWSNDHLRCVIRSAIEKRCLLSKLGSRTEELDRASAGLQELRTELLRSFG